MSPAGSTASTTEASTAAGSRVESGRFRTRTGAEEVGAAWGEIDFGPATAVADSLLYEQWLSRRNRPLSHLPGKTSARDRWQGVLAPRGWVEARGSAPSGERDDLLAGEQSWWSRTECLVEADLDARMEVRLRYLQLSGEDGANHLGGTLPREATVAFTLGEVVGSGIVVTVDSGDRLQARFLVSASIPASPFQLYKISVRVENAVRAGMGEWTLTPREALRRSLISAHILLGVENGSFLSLIDPPHWALAAAATCRNVRSFPVLSGPRASCGIVLSAPIALHDHPRITNRREVRLPRVG